MVKKYFHLDKIILVPIEYDDLSIVLNWINNEEISYFNGSRFPIGMIEQKNWFDRISKDLNSKRLIIQNSQGEKVGIVSLLNIDYRNRKSEIAVYIDPKFHNQGFAKLSLSTIIDFGFKELNLNKIYAKIFSFNISSIKLFESLNFQFEAKLKDEIYTNNQFNDILIYTIYKK